MYETSWYDATTNMLLGGGYVHSMEYQMLIYFAKMTFLSLLFPQDVISYFSKSLW